ncbi:MAG TPA: PKD domain-containing protein [Candidatus Sumerlaeia bacterium]|nr:PKD domain-containing protein [Candidatus Sumerlaeia bacterium]
MKTKLFLSVYMLFFCALFLSVYALPPDIDQTDRVDGKDLIRFSRAWQKKTGEEGWNERADLDYSGLIDEEDYKILQLYFGLQGRVRRVWISQGTPNTIMRFADDGELIGSFSGAGNPRLFALFPGDGSLWSLNTSQGKLFHYDSNGRLLSTVSGFNTPAALSVNEKTGQCWVANTVRKNVVLISPDVPADYNIASQTGFHKTIGGFNEPVSVSVDSTDGSCWVADAKVSQIIKLDANGDKELLRIGGFPNASLVIVNPVDGAVWVETNDYFIRQTVKCLTSGVRIKAFDSGALLCVSRNDGSVLVQGTTYSEVCRISANGEEIFRVGGFGWIIAAFADPVSGCFWLLDQEKNEVVKLSAGGATLLRIGGVFGQLSSGAIDDGEPTFSSYPRAAVQASPLKGGVPLKVFFAAQIENAGGAILNYQWDFDGDGLFDWMSQTTGDVSHTYETPGIYNPIFRAVNEKGLAAVNTSLLITAGEPEIRLDASPASGAAPLKIALNTILLNIPRTAVHAILYDLDGDGNFDALYEGKDILKGLSVSHTYRKIGDFYPMAKVVLQEGGEVCASATVEVHSPAPTVKASAKPAQGYMPLSVELSAQAKDDDGSVVLYEWDFDNDGIFDWRSTTQSNVLNVYRQKGNFTALVRVTDNDGLQASDVVPIRVLNKPPDVTADAEPRKGNVPLLVNLKGQATDADGSVVLYEWSPKGDGNFIWQSPSAGLTSYTYTEPGIYHATFRATDDEGSSATKTVAIEVRNAGKPFALPDAAPRSGAAPLNVNFTAAGSDDDGSIVLYEWFFELPYERLDQLWKRPLADDYSSPDSYCGIAYNKATGHLIFASNGGKNFPAGFYIIDPATGRTIGKLSENGVSFMSLSSAPRRKAIGIAPSGKIFHQDGNGDIVMWANEGAKPVVVYDDPENDEFSHTIDVIEPAGVVYVYTCRYATKEIKIYRLDGALLTHVNTVSCSPAGNTVGTGIAVSADGKTLYTSYKSLVFSKWVSPTGPLGTYTRDATFAPTQTAPESITLGYAESFPEKPTALLGTLHDSPADKIFFFDAAGVESRSPALIEGAGYRSYASDIDVDWDNRRIFYGFGVNGIGCIHFSPGAYWSSPTPGTIAHQYNVWGVYHPMLRVRDNSGFTDETALEINVLSPPSAKIIFPENNVISYRNNLIFRGSGEDKDGQIVKYEWDFDGDGTWDWASDKEENATWADADFAEHNAFFRVTDSDGLQDTVSTHYKIVSSAPKVAAQAEPARGNVPVTVTFNGTATDADGWILDYMWDFDGDGIFDWFNGEPRGAVIACTSESPNSKADKLIDGSLATNNYWLSAANPAFPIDITFKLKGDTSQQIDRIILSTKNPISANYRVKDFEAHITDEETAENFVPWIRGTMNSVAEEQTFTSITLSAKYVKLRILSVEKGTSYASLGEFEVYAGKRNVLTNPGAKATYIFNTPGIYNAELRVIDNDGFAGSDVIPIQVNASNSPAASIIAMEPSPGWRTEPILFMGIGEDANGQVVKYEWDLEGDGTYDLEQTKSGSVVSWTSQYNTTTYAAKNIIDGLAENSKGWRSNSVNFPQELVMQLADAEGGSPVNLACVAINVAIGNPNNNCAKDFTVSVSSTAADSGFSDVGSFQAMRSKGYQIFTFAPAPARWLKISVTSNYGGGFVEIAEICAAGKPPARNQLAPGGAFAQYNFSGNYKPTFRVTDNDGLMDWASQKLVINSESQKLGSVWVAVTGAHTVKRLSPMGDELWSFESLRFPWSVAANVNTKDCWIANTQGHNVVKLDPQGAEKLRIAGYNNLKKVEVNPVNGVCWVSDTSNHQVVRLSADGTQEARISGFSGPTGLSVYQADGSCWVADVYNNGRVVKLAANTPDGYDISTQTGFHIFRTGFREPQALAVNQMDGTCVVADNKNNQVVLLNEEASEEIWRISGIGSPIGISVNPRDGNIWVADQSSHRVVRLAPDGNEVFRVSGFNHPGAISVNNLDGTCWVADTDNNRVVKLAPNGNIILTQTGNTQPRGIYVDSGEGAFNPAPTFKAIAGASALEGAVPLVVSFTAASQGGGNIIRYEWDFEGDGVFDYSSPATGDVEHVYEDFGIFNAVLRITDENHQVAYDYHLILKAQGIRATAIAIPTEGFAPLSVVFSHAGFSQNPITKYEWDFNGDGKIDRQTSDAAAKLTYTYNRAGTWTAFLTVTDSAGKTAQTAVVLNIAPNPPDVHNALVSTRIVLGRTLVSFDATRAFDYDGSIVLYEWDYDGDGIYDWHSKTPLIAEYVYPAPGIYRPIFRATDNDGLSSTKQFELTIPNSAPVAKANAEPAIGRAPLTVQFSGDCADYDGSIALYEWDFNGDEIYDWSSNLTATVSHSYNTPAEYTATLRVTDNLGATATSSVPISVKNANDPIVALNGAPLEGVFPLLVNFNAVPQNPANPIVRYEWDFGEAKWTEADGYLRQMLWLGAFKATGGNDVTSHMPDIEKGNPSDKDTFAGRVWSKTNSSSSGIFNLVPKFGGKKNFAYSLVYLYSKEAQRVRFSYGAKDSARFWINESLVETRVFSGSFAFDQFQFEADLKAGWNKVLVAVSHETSSWAFACRITDLANAPIRFLHSVVEPYSASPFVQNGAATASFGYRHPGVYNVKVTAYDSAAKQASAELSVRVLNNPIPVALPRVHPLSGPAPLSCRFETNAKVSTGVIYYYTWDLGDGRTFDDCGNIPRNFSHTYYFPGVYRATLFVKDDAGIIGQGSVDITVFDAEKITAEIEASPISGKAPLDVQFIGRVKSISGMVRLFEWDFNGDGIYDLNGPDAAEPLFKFTTPGQYTVKLRVTDDRGNKATAEKTIYAGVSAGPQIQITANPESGAASCIIAFEADVKPGDNSDINIEWDFDGNGTYDEITSLGADGKSATSHIYTLPGLYNVRARAKDGLGRIGETALSLPIAFSINAWRSAEVLSPLLNQTMSVQSVIGSPARITVWIENAKGEVVKYLAQDADRAAGYYSDVWDGCDSGGNYAPHGTYYFYLRYSAGDITGLIDHEKPMTPIKGYEYGDNPTFTYPSRFHALEDRPFYLSYTMNEFSDVFSFISDVGARNPIDPWVAPLSIKEARPAGNYIDIWDGTNGRKRFIPTLSEAAVIGVWSWKLPDNAVLLSMRPQISGVTKDPDYLYPLPSPYKDTDGLTIQYTISCPAYVQIDIESDDGALVKRIEQTHDTAGAKSAFWDGFNTDGTPPLPGVYKIHLSALDSYGNESLHVYDLFRIQY